MTAQLPPPKAAAEEPIWRHKDLVAIRGLTAEELTTILDTASAFKTVGTREIKKVPALAERHWSTFSSSRAPAPGHRSSSPPFDSAPTW
jgi:hypothetical protein